MIISFFELINKSNKDANNYLASIAKILDLQQNQILKITEKISFGGKSLRKYSFLGRSSYDDGKGYVLGGDLVYDISTFPLSFALSSRANLVNTSSLGSTMWVSLGVNVGVKIP